MFRVPTSHLPDDPMVNPMDVDFEPSPDDIVLIRDLVCYTLSKQLAQHPRLRKFEQCVRCILQTDGA